MAEPAAKHTSEHYLEPILIDDATRAGPRGQFSVDALGPVPLRGKARSVDVFAVPIGQKS